MESIHECSQTTRVRRDRQIRVTYGARRGALRMALRLPRRYAALANNSGHGTGLAGLSLVGFC
jgi:hypothetical protein